MFDGILVLNTLLLLVMGSVLFVIDVLAAGGYLVLIKERAVKRVGGIHVFRGFASVLNKLNFALTTFSSLLLFSSL